YRLVSQDPVDAPAFAPLLHVGIKRLVTARESVRGEIALIGSYETGRVHVLAQVGALGDFSRDDPEYESYPGIGAGVLVAGDLRVGGELYSELQFHTTEPSWAIAGPNLSWTHGRFWISGMYGIGVYGIKSAPRVQWGIAF